MRKKSCCSASFADILSFGSYFSICGTHIPGSCLCNSPPHSHADLELVIFRFAAQTISAEQSTCVRRSTRASRCGRRDLSPRDAISDLSGESLETARTLRLLAAPPGQFSSTRSRLRMPILVLEQTALTLEQTPCSHNC
jgi:hypothetical protein